jgi:hypothetical protein
MVAKHLAVSVAQLRFRLRERRRRIDGLHRAVQATVLEVLEHQLVEAEAVGHTTTSP